MHTLKLGRWGTKARRESGKEHALEGLGFFQRLVKWKTGEVSFGTRIYTRVFICIYVRTSVGPGICWPPEGSWLR